MPIPAAFTYSSKADFRERFFLPLFQRLGFSLVANLHGSLEFGKDLVFAELDRLGYVRYHGLHAKYGSSIGLSEVESLISDCKQALSNPFQHPHTGESHNVLVFYAVNGGSISDQARDHFLNSLVPQYGPRVRLLDGPGSLDLGRWATVNRTESIRESLAGLILESKYNARVLSTITQCLNKVAAGTGFLPMQRLRLAACANYLLRPLLPVGALLGELEEYWQFASELNGWLDVVSAPGRDRSRDIPELLALVTRIAGATENLRVSVQAVIQEIQPLAAVWVTGSRPSQGLGIPPPRYPS